MYVYIHALKRFKLVNVFKLFLRLVRTTDLNMKAVFCELFHFTTLVTSEIR